MAEVCYSDVLSNEWFGKDMTVGCQRDSDVLSNEWFGHDMTVICHSGVLSNEWFGQDMEWLATVMSSPMNVWTGHHCHVSNPL